MIVAIEGIDACGKGTQCKLLEDHFKAQGRQVRNLHFPHYETLAGGVAGRLLRGDTVVLGVAVDLKAVLEGEVTLEAAAELKRLYSEALDQASLDKATIVQSVMLADRTEWQEELLAWHGKNSERYLILDRYKMSGLVYGQADGLPREWLINSQHVIKEPEVSILIDIPVEESFKRRPHREDYYERDHKKLEKVRCLYLQEFSRREAVRTNSEGSYWAVEGLGSEEEVFERIKAVIENPHGVV